MRILEGSFNSLSKHAGARHPEMLKMKAGLSGHLPCANDRPKAAAHGAAVFAGMKEANGPGHPNTLKAKMRRLQFVHPDSKPKKP